MSRASAERERRQDDAAEKIIKSSGLTFALAVATGKVGDLAAARSLLKAEIVCALSAEFERGQRDASGG